jgi:hypothetical protein
VGVIIVRRAVAGRMSIGIFAVGISAFLLGFIHPGFFLLAWISLFGGVVWAVLLGRSRPRSVHPTVSHLAPDPQQGKPTQSR